MTIEDKLKGMLIENGMWPEQADRVIEEVKGLEANEAMAERWQHDLEGYPSQILGALWWMVREVALEDIEINTPDAFYRCMFEEETVVSL